MDHVLAWAEGVGAVGVVGYRKGLVPRLTYLSLQDAGCHDTDGRQVPEAVPLGPPCDPRVCDFHPPVCVHPHLPPAAASPAHRAQGAALG